jgi:hypothetical protein
LRTESRTLIGGFALNVEDGDQLDYEASIVDCWEQLPSTFGSGTFKQDGCTVTVKMDWSPVSAHLAKQLAMSRDLRKGRGGPTEEWVNEYWSQTRVPVVVELSGRSKQSEYDWYPDFFVQCHVYDVFVAFNLALPGAADFLGVGVIPKHGGPPEHLELSAFYFEKAARTQGQWPPLRRLPLEKVMSWYRRVRAGFGQVPTNPVERALFAMLHVCRSQGRPEDIIWLFYAFESLFQTKVGENYAALVDRIRLVLQPDSTQEKALRKQLRAMYEYRSAFVHGGLAVIHPMHHEVMDIRVDESYRTTVSLSEDGMRLLLACLQRYIGEDWRAVRYSTILEPANDEA